MSNDLASVRWLDAKAPRHGTQTRPNIEGNRNTILHASGTPGRLGFTWQKHRRLRIGWAAACNPFGICKARSLEVCSAPKMSGREKDREHAVGDARSLFRRARGATTGEHTTQHLAHQCQAAALVLAEGAKRARAFV